MDLSTTRILEKRVHLITRIRISFWYDFATQDVDFWGSLYGYQLLAEAKSPPKIVNKKVEVAYVLWRMARPTHLRLIAFVYLLGATMAMALGAAFDAQLLVFGLVVLLLVSSSVHYANEYADYETDALTQRDIVLGWQRRAARVNGA